MFQLHCIRKLLCFGLFLFLCDSINSARADENSTYWGCLVQSETAFVACVEDGPLSAKLAGDIRQQLDDAQAKMAAGGADGQWALYSVRFEERRFFERLHEAFDLSRRPVASLPQPIRAVINEVAVRVAEMTDAAPNGTFEELWTAETHAVVASAVRTHTSEFLMATPAPMDESAVIGQRFVEIFATMEDSIAALPISEGQYGRIGLFQLAASTYLSSRDTARAAELHNELVAFREDLLARGEEVSPDIDALQRSILEGVLEAGA